MTAVEVFSVRATWARAPGVLWRNSAEELLLLVPDGALLTANLTAAEVWHQLKQPKAAERITAALSDLHDGDPTTIRAAVEAALHLLEQRGAVRRGVG